MRNDDNNGDINEGMAEWGEGAGGGGELIGFENVYYNNDNNGNDDDDEDQGGLGDVVDAVIDS